PSIDSAQMLGWRLSRLQYRLREVISIFPAFLNVLFLIMRVQVFFCILKMSLADFVQPLLVKQQGSFVVGRELVHLRHRQRVDGTGLDTVAAKDAFCNVDVELAGESLQWTLRILRTDDLDTTRWTGGFTEVTADTTFLVIVIA